MSRNRAVHPDFNNDLKDHLFLDWIVDAFDRRHVDIDKVSQEGYEYLKHELFKDTETSYWIHYFKVDFDNTLERKIQKSQYNYLDSMAYDTTGNSWVDKEGREHDLDLEDTELDHVWQQNQLLKECLNWAIMDWDDTETFFENQENYQDCLRQAPDVVYFDDEMLKQESMAFAENMRKYKVFHENMINK